MLFFYLREHKQIKSIVYKGFKISNRTPGL